MFELRDVGWQSAGCAWRPASRWWRCSRSRSALPPRRPSSRSSGRHPPSAPTRTPIGSSHRLEPPAHQPAGRRALGVGLFDYRDRSGLFDDVVGIWTITANLTGGSEPQRVETALASPTYFQRRRAAAVGRLFGPQDYAGISPVVVISDGLWRRAFGADRAVLGRDAAHRQRPARSSASPSRHSVIRA